MAQINRRASAVRRAGYPAPETFEPQQQFQPPPQMDFEPPKPMDFEPPKPEPFDPTEAFDFYKSKTVTEPLFWDEARRDTTKENYEGDPNTFVGGRGWMPKSEGNWGGSSNKWSEGAGTYSPRYWTGKGSGTNQYDSDYERPAGNWAVKDIKGMGVTGVYPGDSEVDTPEHKSIKMYGANRAPAPHITGIDPETGYFTHQYDTDPMSIAAEDYVRPGTISKSDLFDFYEMIMPGVGEGQAAQLQKEIDTGRASEYFDPDWYLGRDTQRTVFSPEAHRDRIEESYGYVPKDYETPVLQLARGIDWTSPELGKDRDSYESTYEDGGAVGSGVGDVALADKYWDGRNYVSSPAETAANAAAGVAPADLLGQVGKSYHSGYGSQDYNKATGQPRYGNMITDVSHGGVGMIGNVSPEGAHDARLLGARGASLGLGPDRRYNKGEEEGHDYSPILSPTAAALQAAFVPPTTPQIVPEKYRRV